MKKSSNGLGHPAVYGRLNLTIGKLEWPHSKLRSSFAMLVTILISTLLFSSCTSSQRSQTAVNRIKLSEYTRSFVKIDTSKIALIGAKVFDGRGTQPKSAQTVLIQNGVILEVGDSEAISVPKGFQKLAMNGKTIIPGIVGTHNHMRFPRGALFFSSPRLYLASGVTTIQTCGTGHPKEEIAIDSAIKSGKLPGPEIIGSSPYFTGPEGKANFIRNTDEQLVRDTISALAKIGVKWIKVYQRTRPEDLRIIVDEAHKNGLKVTGHLCATTYTEAAHLGIDAIEHGFIHSFDHAEEHVKGTCSGNRNFRSQLNIDSEEVRQVQSALIHNNVALSSTPSIFETQAGGAADPRDLEALAPFYVEAYSERRVRKEKQGADWYFKEIWLTKSLAYDLAFYTAGGILTAGPDPGLHNLPGYGDQKNYELFIEGGFTPAQAIQVMTFNGAKSLGLADEIGSIEKGKKANLVLLDGDLEKMPSVIRKVDIVFKEGIGFDPQKMIRSVRGLVGSEMDEQLFLGK
ncbi:amidohydrolase family protein [Maribacter sp. 2307UL18-2]|uniref:amidohydrolase family protein n=1 Tax=Maribacter sp. 2307UL18-2 TaxID=3386274 RepID=UPI0039BC7139